LRRGGEAVRSGDQIRKIFEIASQFEPFANTGRIEPFHSATFEAGSMRLSKKATRNTQESMMSLTRNQTKTYGRYPMCPAATYIVNHDANVKEESP